MIYLLDINFLVALFDGSHVNHEDAHVWFGRRASRAWATCPITENGCVRVLSNPAYPSVSATPNEIISRLATFCSSGGHLFWPDDASILDLLDQKERSRLLGHQQITDFYLAGLASKNGGKLATFDGSLARSIEGTELADSLELVGNR